MKKKLMMGGGVLLLLVAGVAAGIFLAPMLQKADAAPAAEDGTGEEIVADAAADAEAAAGAHGAAPAATAEGGKKTAETKDLRFKFENDFMINLLDPSGRQFVLLGLQLEASSADALKRIETNVPPLRDATIMLISTKSREELQSATGMDRLKRDLAARYEGVLGPRVVGNLYITDIRFGRQ